MALFGMGMLGIDMDPCSFCIQTLVTRETGTDDQRGPHDFLQGQSGR